MFFSFGSWPGRHTFFHLQVAPPLTLSPRPFSLALKRSRSHYCGPPCVDVLLLSRRVLVLYARDLLDIRPPFGCPLVQRVLSRSAVSVVVPPLILSRIWLISPLPSTRRFFGVVFRLQLHEAPLVDNRFTTSSDSLLSLLDAPV